MDEKYRQACLGGVRPVPVGGVSGRRGVGGQKAEESPWKDSEEPSVGDVVVGEAMYSEESGHYGIE